jgi:hypothetical protein
MAVRLQPDGSSRNRFPGQIEALGRTLLCASMFARSDTADLERERG